MSGGLKNLVLFTNTFYDQHSSNVRPSLTIKTIKNAIKEGVRIVVSDSGTTEHHKDYLNELEQLAENPLVTLIRLNEIPELGQPLMGDSRRLNLFLAAGGTVEEWIVGKREMPENAKDLNFMWLEPEKFGLVKRKNLLRINNALNEGHADIVVPERERGRAKTGMGSAPFAQRVLEPLENQEAAEIIRKIVMSENPDAMGFLPEDFGYFDLWFGPKAFNIKGAELFLQNNGEKWNGIIDFVHTAIENGLKVLSMPVQFAYTKEQRWEENVLDEKFIKKRADQLLYIIDSLGGDASWFKWKPKEERMHYVEDQQKRYCYPSSIEGGI